MEIQSGLCLKSPPQVKHNEATTVTKHITKSTPFLLPPKSWNLRLQGCSWVKMVTD